MKFVGKLKNQHGTTVQYVEVEAWRDIEAWTQEFLHSVLPGWRLTVDQEEEK